MRRMEALNFIWCPAEQGASGYQFAIERQPRKTHNTMKTLMMSAALCCAMAVNAQSTPTTTPADAPQKHLVGKHDCLMATDAEFKSLGVSEDQLSKVKDIQARCSKECAAAMKEKGSLDHAAMDKHEKELQAALTPEQYTKWQHWCSTKKVDKAEGKK